MSIVKGIAYKKYKLSQVFDLQMGKTPSRNNPQYWEGCNKWLSISDLDGGKIVTKTREAITNLALQDTNIKKVPQGTVVMSFKLSIGKTAITGEDMYTNEAIMAFHIKDGYEVDTDFLYHWCKSNNWLDTTNKAVMGLTLNKATMMDKEIKLPDISKQKEIAVRLNKVDDALVVGRKQLEMMDLLVKSRFIEMFGNPVVNPKGLKKVLLADLSELITKGASPNWQGFVYTDDNTQTLFVTSENVREGFLDLTTPKYIEDGFNEKQKRSLLRKGDFLINIVGASIGRAAQYNFLNKANINQAVALVRVKPNTIRDNYLLYYLNSEKAQRMYNAMKSDTGRANLSLQDIANLEILLPSIGEQDEFDLFMQQVDKSKLAVQKSLNDLETLKNSLMQQYFG